MAKSLDGYSRGEWGDLTGGVKWLVAFVRQIVAVGGSVSSWHYLTQLGLLGEKDEISGPISLL